MSEDPAARRLVTPADIIGLAELLDRLLTTQSLVRPRLPNANMGRQS